LHPKDLVRSSYDQIAETYAAWSAGVADVERERLTARLAALLPPGADVLDLGCGNGLPSTRQLAERFQVTGVDASAAQLELARVQAPNAAFLQADMAAVDFPSASFDAVTAYYSIIHLPRTEHLALFERVADWLRPGGYFLLSLGEDASDDGLEEDWLGAPMYWSHFDAAGSRALLKQAGFVIGEETHVALDEGHGLAHFVWFLAHTPR
jgi:ubiquinone/menaquinone biosynthesis C-methylase UbiE